MRVQLSHQLLTRVFYMLLQLELFLSSGTVCLSIYSLVAAIFGMNIPYTWNTDHGYVFKWVSLEIAIYAEPWQVLQVSFINFHSCPQVVSLSGIASAVLFILIITYARLKGLVGSWTIQPSSGYNNGQNQVVKFHSGLSIEWRSLKCNYICLVFKDRLLHTQVQDKTEKLKCKEDFKKSLKFFLNRLANLSLVVLGKHLVVYYIKCYYQV